MRAADISPPREGSTLMTAWPLAGRRVLVVGGGEVAAGRLRLAVEADADCVLVAPRLGAATRPLLPHVTWLEREAVEDDLEGAALAFVAIDDPAASARLAREARRRGVPVNVADVPALCDFWLPSVHRDGPLQVAVSTTGQGPALAARLRRELASAIPEAAARATERFGVLRRRVRAVDPAPESGRRRMRWLGALARSWSWERLATLDEAGLGGLLGAYLAGAEPPGPRGPGPGRRVTLVGAGPGDPGLITVAGARALAEADLVVADRIVPPALHRLVTGRLRIARKTSGRADAAQAEIEALVLEAAARGEAVVRLKAGDPFVFGRGAEEIERFAAAGLQVDVIPGLSSALAGPLLGGIPTTARGLADRVLVLTGHGQGGSWPDLPDFQPTTTYVLLMAVGRIGGIVERLLAAGWPPTLPAAAVQQAGQPDQRRLISDLRALPGDVVDAGIRAPAVIVLGDVVAARAELAAAVGA